MFRIALVPLVPLALAMLLGTSDQAAAQYLNRALYLGREEEGIRSDFDQNVDYFLSRFSFLPAPWWKAGLDPFGNVFEYYAGSASTNELTIEGRVHLRHDLGGGAAGHFHFLQSETRDTQFARSAVEFEGPAGESWSGFVLLEGTTDKSVADASVGAYFSDARLTDAPPSYGIRGMLTAVDFAAHKNDATSYSKDAYGLMLSGFLGRDGDAQLGFELGSQLPARLEETDVGQSFSIARHLGKLQSRLPLGGRDWFVTELEFEYTSKRIATPDVSDPRREYFRRDYASFRAEWWRRFASGNEFSAGALLFCGDEVGDRPNDPGRTFVARRDEYFGIARGRLMMGERWALDPSIHAGYTDFDERLGPTERTRSTGFQGTAGLGFTYRFRATTQLMFNLTLDIDRANFGGGNVQFRTIF